ncbi:hypothetical protein ABH999_004400 [Bradyrhizobium yuanmingense]|uniref:hypothetical protein n=1 Tax=Bradyrhizobium yuanmingense TaxID=108015 RepID=UPI003513ADBF
MALAMSRPWKHPKTGIYQLGRAVREDLRALGWLDLHESGTYVRLLRADAAN